MAQLSADGAMNDSKQGRQLSQLINQGILSIMGVLFCVLAFTRAKTSRVQMLMLGVGVLLILMGVIRVWIVAQLFREVGDDACLEETQEQQKSEER